MATRSREVRSPGLSPVLQDVQNPPGPSLEPPPQSSTSTRAQEETRAMSRPARVGTSSSPIYVNDEYGDGWEDIAAVEYEESILDTTEDEDQ